MIELGRSRLTYESEGREYRIEIDSDGLTLSAFLEELVEPLLLAAGYAPGSINEALWGIDADV